MSLLAPLGTPLRGKRLLLHVGTPKTGTTALQRWLQGNRTHLVNHGFLYPVHGTDGEAPKHQWLINALRQSDGAMVSEAAAEIAAEMGDLAQPIHTVILSTEGLFNHFASYFSAHGACFGELAGECRLEVVACFRDPIDYACSRYRQNLVNPPTGDPFHATSLSLEELCRNEAWLAGIDYKGFLEAWERLLGPEAVICLPYGPEFVADFSARMLGLPCREAPVPPQQANASLGAFGVAMVQQLNGLDLPQAAREKVLPLLLEADRSLPAGTNRFTPGSEARTLLRRAALERLGGLAANRPELTLPLAVLHRPARSSAPAPACAESPDLCFLCCIEAGFLEQQVVRLAQSIRLFTGEFHRCRILAVCPTATPLAPDTLHQLHCLEVSVVLEPLNRKLRTFPYANKAYALEYAETQCRESVLVLLDSDTLFVAPPTGFQPDVHWDFRARPVDLRNISASPLDSDHRQYWQQLCALGGIGIEQLPIEITTVDRTPIHANYNGGLLAVRRSSGVGQRWRQLLESCWQNGISPAPGNFWGSGQSTFSVAAAALGLRCLPLEAGYNIPMHLPEAEARLDWIEHPTHLHYHWMFEPEYLVTGQERLQRLRLQDEVRHFLRQLPALTRRRGPSHTGSDNRT